MNIKSWWNNTNESVQVVIIIVLMATSPLWLFPALLAFMIVLTWGLIDKLIRGD